MPPRIVTLYNYSITPIAALIACLLSTSAFLIISANSQIESPTSSLTWSLTYSLTTDNETYHAPTMIESTIWITNRNPYPMNFTPPSPFIYSGGYLGEYNDYVFVMMPDWVFSQVPANSTMRLTTMSFSATKAGYFEITWRGLRKVVKVV